MREFTLFHEKTLWLIGLIGILVLVLMVFIWANSEISMVYLEEKGIEVG